jgi:aquaporin Z
MQKLLVEFLGTFAIAYVVLATGNPYAIGAVFVLALILGAAISGGAFNPATAVAMWMAKKISRADLLPYILAQVLGGVAAYEAFRRFGRLSL